MQNDKHNPTISVVVPVYNVAPYVERCLQSVMRQTYSATECILVDDASSDDSIERCQRLITGYSGPTKFVILHHSSNRGLSASRNTGTDAAISSYIYYLDSDDEITPDCLEKLMAPILEDDSIEMVMGGSRKDYSQMSGLLSRLKQWIRVRQTEARRNHDKVLLELNNNEEVYKWYYCSKNRRSNYEWNKLLKLSFVKENLLYDREGLILEDRLWNFYLLRCLNHAVIIPDVTYIYYQRSSSIIMGSGSQKKREHRGRIFREMAENIIPGERLEETENRLWGFCRNYIDASDNPDYQYAYEAFLRQMSDGHHKSSVRQLKRAHRLAKSRFGRALYKSLHNKKLRILFNSRLRKFRNETNIDR